MPISLSSNRETLGYPRRFRTGAEAGEFDPHTVLLLHMDGANNGVAFVDSSRGGIDSPHTVTANGGAKTTTADRKLGSACAIFDTTGNDFLSIPDSQDWNLGTREWTIDFWLKHDGSGDDFQGIISNDEAYALNTWQIGITKSTMNVYWNTRGFNQFSAGNISANTWTHFAFVRRGQNIITFKDGIVITNTAHTAPFYYYNQGLRIGRMYFDATTNRDLTGKLDELRISSIARWTANFTPPTAPYRP
jgi:hypothetical protein